MGKERVIAAAADSAGVPQNAGLVQGRCLGGGGGKGACFHLTCVTGQTGKRMGPCSRIVDGRSVCQCVGVHGNPGQFTAVVLELVLTPGGVVAGIVDSCGDTAEGAAGDGGGIAQEDNFLQCAEEGKIGDFRHTGGDSNGFQRGAPSESLGADGGDGAVQLQFAEIFALVECAAADGAAVVQDGLGHAGAVCEGIIVNDGDSFGNGDFFQIGAVGKGAHADGGQISVEIDGFQAAVIKGIGSNLFAVQIGGF